MLTDEQKQKLKTAGYSDVKIKAYEVQRFGTPTAATQLPAEAETALDGHKSFFSRLADDVRTRQQNVTDSQSAQTRGEQGSLETVLQAMGQSAATIFGDLPGEAVKSAYGALPEPVRNLAHDAGSTFMRTPIARAGLQAVQGGADTYNEWKTANPRAARNLEAVVNLSAIVPAGKAAQVAVKGAGTVARATADAAGDAVTRARSLFSRPSSSVDDVIAQADEALKTHAKADAAIKPGMTPAQIRTQAEANKPELTVQEKWVGVSPDIKKRIQGKQDQLREYFDVSHARNYDDTLPTAYEHGSARAQTAVEAMEQNLNETGGKIGATRQKLGTLQAPPDQVASIEQSFIDQLGKLNLEIRSGTVQQIAGTVAKAGSSNDVKVLNDLYQNLKVVKQSPTLTNLIDLRSAFDAKINFSKASREASNSVDPVSRQVRKQIADTAGKIVGKSEAAELGKYSDFMDAYNDLRSYTDRRAGGEYLLRLVLSGRGGEARKIIETIKEYTGIDLMDDATMMTLATDVVGNPRQKNLFRQEVTNAGLDAASLLRGDVTGVMAKYFQKAVDKAVDPEKVLLDAAK